MVSPAAAPPPMGMGGVQPMSMSMAMGMNQMNQIPMTVGMDSTSNAGASNTPGNGMPISSMPGGNNINVPSQQIPMQTGPPGAGMDANTLAPSQDLDPLAALMAPP